MKRGFVFVLIAVTLAGSFFAACTPKGGSGSSSQTVVLNCWKGPNSEDEAQLWQAIIDKFQAENPGIRVDFLVTPWDTYVEKYTAAFAGGSPPDVFHLGDIFYPPFAEQGVLADLTSYAPASVKDMVGYDLMHYKGKLYGITFNAFASALFYNVDIFNAAGLPVPTTWDEFRSTAKALTKNGIWGFSGNIYRGFGQILIPFIMQSGGTMMNAAMTELNFGTAEKQRGIQLMMDMIDIDRSIPKINDYSEDEFNNLFVNGRSAMIIAQIQSTDEFKLMNPDLNFKIATVPVGPASDPTLARAQYGCVEGLHMAQASKYKDQVWKFIDFVTIRGESKSYLKRLNFFSGFPAIDAQMFDMSDHDIQVAAEGVKNMFLYPASPQMNEILPEYDLMVEEIFYKTKSIMQAYNDCNAKVREICAQ